jgi:hypothetical protein
MCVTICASPGCVMSTTVIPVESPISAYSPPDGDV